MLRWFAAWSLAATAVTACAVDASAAELDVRLRIAWGSSAQAPQSWSGEIHGAGLTLSGLQPLGVEADEAAALRLVDDRIVIAPLVPRVFDGCDVTIRGDDRQVVTIRLHNSSAAEAKEVQVPLSELARIEYRTPLDDLGGFLLVNRAPGDRLRVTLNRDHLVFGPSEQIAFEVAPNLDGLPAEPLTLEVRLTPSRGGAALWEAKFPYAPDNPAPIAVDLPAPAAEGAYRVSLALRGQAGLTRKLTPWQPPAPVAARDVELVVVDPTARLPRILPAEDEVQSIDPAGTAKWWRRVPEWTQMDRLPGLSAPRTLGNVKAVPLAGTKSVVELPPPAAGGDAAWQAYGLSIREVGAPHVVEVALPADAPLEMAISIIEADAAGRVQTFGRDAGTYIDAHAEAQSATATSGAGAMVLRRVVFWPRTATPVLLLANQSPTRSARYGMIRVLRRRTEDAELQAAAVSIGANEAGNRLVAAYISLPRFAECLGAAEQLDAASGLSVDSWSTFLDASQRLAQHLRAAGYNAAIVSIAADGASLAPIDALGSTPRYDAGLLATTGQDPIRKDVLEVLLRVFDREGLQVVPAIELATPLPQLEALLAAGKSALGIACVGDDGQTWNERYPGQAVAPRYNVLDPRVQAAIGEVVQQVATRYGGHRSLGGVALQLSGRGYGVLPGAAWCLDDVTTARFAKASQIVLPTAGADRFQQRASMLTGPESARWLTWRCGELTNFYAKLGQQLSSLGDPRSLVLCTEQSFAGAEASHRIRQAVSGRGSIDAAAAEIGINFARLAATPGVQLLRPRLLSSDESLEARALDWHVTDSPELDLACQAQPRAGELFYFAARRLRLPSFDAQSPFGADRTHLSTAAPGFPIGVAANRALVAALAAREFYAWVDGAEALPLVDDNEATRLRRLFQELPGQGADVRVEQRQPATMRVYRTAQATTILLVNDSPWPLDVQAPLELTAPATWRELGADVGLAGPMSQAVGASVWQITLPPYGVAARTYESRNLRVGSLALTVGDDARRTLATRIEELDQRTRRLDSVERPYPQLQNPGFELTGADGLMLGWQPRIGAAGQVAIDDTAAVAGARALHLRSEDALGVAAQSHLFPIPATGQLAVRAKVRVRNLGPESRLYAWAEFDAGGVPRREYAELGEGQLGEKWTTCEFAVDDLPLASTGQMRVQFHLAGPGEAWVDGVELFDLRFGKEQRMDLVVRLYAARTALEQGQLVDCQRFVDGYWPRRLAQVVPLLGSPSGEQLPPNLEIARVPDDAPPPPTEGEASPGIGDRLRSLTPRKFW